MRRRNIVSSRGARDLVKHSVRTRKVEILQARWHSEDTGFMSLSGIHRPSHLDSRTSAFIFELNQAIVRGVATSRKRPVPARTASHLSTLNSRRASPAVGSRTPSSRLPASASASSSNPGLWPTIKAE
jgi:hypothetical protein